MVAAIINEVISVERINLYISIDFIIKAKRVLPRG
jgi:hypothetical protein